MLAEIFMQILDMTRTASLVIGMVMLARLVLKRAPRIFSYALWALVLFRLLCTVSLEAPVSLLPQMESVSESYTLADVPVSPLGVGTAVLQAVGDATNGGLGIQQIPTAIADSEGYVMYVQSGWWEVWVLAGQYLWPLGMAAMAAWAAASYIRLKRKLLTASPLRENIYLVDGLPSPFVMGLIRPKIYLPSDMEEREQRYILLHERYHIRRGDHLWKALGFLALCIHWFNPLVWLAFVLAGRDMEMSCDEAVIRKLGEHIRADYSASLLSLATGRRIFAGMPLAFGEGDPKGRIRNLARWRKPAAWLLAVCAGLCAVLAVVLLTNPGASRSISMDGTNAADLDPQKLLSRIAQIYKLEDISEIRVNSNNFDVQLTGDFEWLESPAITFFYHENQEVYSAQLRIYPEEARFYVTEQSQWPEQSSEYLLLYYLEALKYLPQEKIRSLSDNADGYIVQFMEEGIPNDFAASITYTPDGAGSIDGWYIHLRVLPMYASSDGGYTGEGSEELHLFYSHSQTGSNRLLQTTYVPYQCIYMNPLSSYAAIGGDSGYQYVVEEDTFAYVSRNTYAFLAPEAETTVNRIPVESWKWRPFPYTGQQWEALFFPQEIWSFDIYEYFEEILYLPLTKQEFLLRADGDLWLVKLSHDDRIGTYLWSIYSLVPESMMGHADWEYFPLSSARVPAFRFTFDMPYTEIRASCVNSQLWDHDSVNGDSGSTVTLDAGHALYWLPSDSDGNPVDYAVIRFTVINNEESYYSGTIYVTLSEESTDLLPTYVYSASLTGTGLHLEPSADGYGGVITLISD